MVGLRDSIVWFTDNYKTFCVVGLVLRHKVNPIGRVLCFFANAGSNWR